MTRLEEIEAWLKDYGPCGDDECAMEKLLYALDCYRARVAVLEEACRKACAALIHFCSRATECVDIDVARNTNEDVIEALAITPEQCLERQKGEG